MGELKPTDSIDEEKSKAIYLLRWIHWHHWIIPIANWISYYPLMS